MTNSDTERKADVLTAIAEYAADPRPFPRPALDAARHSMLDALGCATLALRHPECTRLIGPVVPGATLPEGVPIPGTDHRLDPVTAAFDIGALVRWLDYNDAWLAAEWGHPSDNLGAILAAAHHASTIRLRAGRQPLTGADVLDAVVRAHEIQGVLALRNSFNRRGLDHVLLVRVASAAVATRLLGGGRDQIRDAVSQAFADGGCLRVYRHGRDTGSRKSWAAGDATSRGVWLALLTLRGEPGYPGVLTAPTWGFQDVLYGGQPLMLDRPLGSHVIENVLFKVLYPAEFHAQTSLEAAVELHPRVAERIDRDGVAAVERIEIATHSAALRIIDKTGPLRNPADRDHCLQYITAVALLRGGVTAEDYADEAAADPRIDALRERMVVMENPRFSADYDDPDKRSVASTLRVSFADGTDSGAVTVEYPLGHPARRAEALPLLREKFRANLATRFDPARAAAVADLFDEHQRLADVTVPALLELFAAQDRQRR